MTQLSSSRIVLGVTGGIAAYKAADLTSKLVQQGATVDVVLTEAGSSFISATTFEAITSRKVHSTAFEPWHGSWHGHISLGEEADAFIVAPATANVIAKLAHGIADDMLTTAALAATCPLLIAPAMEHSMYHHAATQENIGTLLGRGATMVGPNQGRLASGDVGDGRMAEPVEILGAARKLVGRNGSLAGMNVVVTAGGTVEPLDPVRYIGNRSSGRMGYELAQAAIDEGADALLISGETCLDAPYGAEVIYVETALAMLEAVELATHSADILIMAAAVSDYRPQSVQNHKMKKGASDSGLTIELVPNPDILKSIDVPGVIRVGFAAETEDLESNARGKLREKSLDLIVANNAQATIGSSTSEATILRKDGTTRKLDRMPKDEVAREVIGEVANLRKAAE